MWRSLVAHLLGVQVVAGSNPVMPTNFKMYGLTFGNYRGQYLSNYPKPLDTQK